MTVTTFCTRCFHQTEHCTCMSAQPSTVQSTHYRPTFTLANDGRRIELRNGCLYFAGTNQAVPGAESSAQTQEFILTNCKLTTDQRNQITEFGSAMFNSDAPMSKSQLCRSKYG